MLTVIGDWPAVDIGIPRVMQTHAEVSHLLIANLDIAGTWSNLTNAGEEARRKTLKVGLMLGRSPRLGVERVQVAQVPWRVNEQTICRLQERGQRIEKVVRCDDACPNPPRLTRANGIAFPGVTIAPARWDGGWIATRYWRRLW